MKNILSAIVLLLFSHAFSQTNSDLEFTAGAGNPTGNGPLQSTTITFQKNTNNPGGTTFALYTPTLSTTFALSNQQYTFAPVPANGLSIGAAAAASVNANASAIFSVMNSNSNPLNANFTYAKGATVGTGMNVGTNRSVQFFTSTTGLRLNNEPLPTPGNDVRYYMSDLTINFNRPVTNPVLHITGLGGAIGTNITFSSELELSTTGLTLTRLSGSAEFSVPTTTQIFNSAAAYSATTGSGAASGSILVNGNSISSLTFKVYLKAKDPNNALNPIWGTVTSHSGDNFSIGVSTLEDDLSISKTVDNSSPVIGGPVTFTILASNNGPSNDTNVIVNDLLPSGFTYVSSAPSTGTYNPLTGVWTIGSLATGITATLTVTATVNLTGNHTNAANMTGDNADSDLANNTTSVYAYPQPDSDKDGIPDNCDLDDDNDGITDLVEEECAPSGQTLRIGYIPDARSFGGGYTFDGFWMSGSGALKLTNPANFGPGGIVNTTIQLVPITANPITKSSITALNLNTVFIGGIDDGVTSYLSVAELAAIKDWSDDSPNNVVVVTQASTTAWNSTIANSNVNPDKPTALGSTTTIFKGPFGTVTTFNQGGSFQGIFSNIDTSCGTKVLAIDSNNNPVIYSDGNYNDLLIGDVDILTTIGGVTSGNAITSNNDKLFANIWANVITRAFCANKDTDGDTIPDRLDVDSDDDLCPDAIEGTENVTAAQVYPLTDPLYPGQIKVKADGITIGLLPSQVVSTSISGSGIPELVNDAVNNSSGTSGVADNTDGSADLGQSIGSSQTVGSPSPISTQPVNKTVQSGTNTTFSVITIVGSGITNYQWQVSIDNGITYSDISNGGLYSGANTATLSITGATISLNGYKYRVAITQSNICANVISNPATLTVYTCGGISDYSLFGDAVINSGNIRLTEAINNEYGTAWTPITYDLNNTFVHSFRVNLGNNLSGADGMAYVIRGVGSASNGAIGRGLGYGGITPSLALEFDSYSNTDLGTNDPAGDHLSLHRNGDYNATGIVPGTSDFVISGGLKDGNWHDVLVEWNPITTNFKVTFDGVVIYNITRDILALDFGGNPDVIVGYSASTGGLNNEHRVCPDPIQITNLACYRPAATTGTVLDTKHGITALGRAGANNGNWPMVRKGAWTALEAKTKGFVVNRIPLTAQVNAIANPIEGMMVYDEEADCLKIYTTTDGTSFSWQCFTTQTCPD